MIGKKNALIPAAFLLYAAGLSFFLNLSIQASRFTILEHQFHFSFFPLFFGFILFFTLLFFGWQFLAKIESRISGKDRFLTLWDGFLASTPLAFFLLSTLLLKHYLTRDDLKTRLYLLAIFILLSLFYLKFSSLSGLFAESWKQRAAGLEAKFSSLSPRKKLLLLFIVAFLIYNACALFLVTKGITFSGDEPNYLLTTHSLLKDGDINLANNYAHKDYFHFYSKEQNPRLKLGVYGRTGKKGKDYIYPINLPGISVLMMPFYWLSQFFKGKLLTFILKASLSLWAVLLGLQVYLFLKETLRKERLALGLWLVYSFSSPILFYAIHLYPEIPVAFFSLLIYRKISSPRPLRLFPLFFLGFLLSTFFWFGLKYNFIFWPLLLISIYFLWKKQKSRWGILVFLSFPLLSFGLFGCFIYNLYGTFSPFAVYEGVLSPEKSLSLKESLFSLPLLSRIETFLDYFFDQRDGLLLYAPFYFFMFSGFVEMFRRAKKELLILLFISLPFLLNYAFFTHRQGHCPQARVLAPISWIGILLVGYFLAYNRHRLFSHLFMIGGAASLTVSGILLSHPSFLYQPTTHEVTQRAGDMFIYLSNLHFFLPSYLPSFIKIRNVEYLPNYLWILAAVVFVLGYVLFKNRGPLRLRQGFHLLFALLLLSASFFLWVLYPRDVPYPTRTFYYSPQKAMGFYIFPMGKGVVAKNEAEFYLHIEKSYKILFSSKTELEKIQLIFGSEKGTHEVVIRFFDLPLYEGQTNQERKQLSFSPPAYYPLRHLYLYEINLSLKKLSDENLLIDPYFLQILPLKN
ncbi:MAG: hypothetical protein WCC06_12675 [Candidatus Aminicenantales bacterium]